MIYSRACAHAIRALSRMATIRPDGNVLRNELCGKTDLPPSFVAKILQDLVRAGLLTSRKGRGGGFALTREPSRISLLDIVAAVDGTGHLDGCALGIVSCDNKGPCFHEEAWKPVRAHILRVLRETNLEQMSQAPRRKGAKKGAPAPKRRKRS